MPLSVSAANGYTAWSGFREKDSSPAVVASLLLGRASHQSFVDLPPILLLLFTPHETVAINDPFLSLDYAAYLLQHDSVHGMYEKEVKAEDGCLVVGDAKIKFFAERNPAGTCEKSKS